MRVIRKLLLWTGSVLLLCAVAGYGVFRYMNRTPPQLKEPNYYSYYQQQDTVPAGRVGMFITHLLILEEMESTIWYTVSQKVLQYIPWPVRNLVAADRGVVLLDPERYYEFEEFAPTRLVDPSGSDTDMDGVPYVFKWRMGEVAWVPPSKTLHLDHGYFLLKKRAGGMPSVAAKLINKARHYYYTPGKASVKGTVPHEAGMRIIVTAAMDEIRARYGDIPYRWVNAENTDTLYFHAMANFENFPEYDRYDTIDYPDWRVPFTREIEHDGTHMIYNGVPVGYYNEPLVRAYVQAIDEVLSQDRQPPRVATQQQ